MELNRTEVRSPSETRVNFEKEEKKKENTTSAVFKGTSETGFGGTKSRRKPGWTLTRQREEHYFSSIQRKIKPKYNCKYKYTHRKLVGSGTYLFPRLDITCDIHTQIKGKKENNIFQNWI